VRLLSPVVQIDTIAEWVVATIAAHGVWRALGDRRDQGRVYPPRTCSRLPPPHARPAEADAEKIWSHHCIGPEAYDKTMSERYWSDRFEMEDSPSARAHRLLGEIDVAPDRCSGRGPQLEFHEGDAYPGDNSFWVNAKDRLSLSPLQARLIDPGMPIKIVEGT